MDTIIGLAMVSLIINYIYNYTPIILDIEEGIGNLLNKRIRLKKPFSCTGCMIFWISIIYLIIIQFNPLYILPVALLNHSLSGFFNRLIDIYLTLINKI